MKKIIPILILLITLVSLGSCRRTTNNGKIDGFWKITEIYYTADGKTVHPERRMIAVQLELMQLQNAGYTATLTGVIHYHKGDPTIGVDFRYNPSDDQLAQYGFAPEPGSTEGQGQYCVLHIEKLDRKHLVLRSPIAVITCRRY